MKKDFKTFRILVVDDNSLILMSLSRFLKKIALVKTASTAEEALEAIEVQNTTTFVFLILSCRE